MTALQYARAAWSRGVYTSLREVLRAMKEGGDVEMRLINRIMSDILNKTERSMEQIGKDAYNRVMSSATPNLFGLNQMLKERSSYYSDRLNDYKFLYKKFERPGEIIGRRGNDLVRELSLETLEEGFLRGNPTAFTETALIDRIVNSPKAVKFADRAAAETAMKEFRSTVIDKIPLFHEDGEPKFLLQVRSGGEDGTYKGKFQAWSAEKYADLVAITTAAEADVAANLDQAREIGTRIVKWNSTGKGREFYMSIGDTRCARVDGQYASLEPDGTTINGVFYPYYKSPERLPGRFNTCHPNCRHRLTPVPEEVLGGQSQGESVTSEDLLRDTPASERAQVLERARLRSLELQRQVRSQPIEENISDAPISTEARTEAQRFAAHVKGPIEIERLDKASQHIAGNIVKELFIRYPKLPQLREFRAVQRGIQTEDGEQIFASSDRGAIRFYPGAQNFDDLKKSLKYMNTGFQKKHGRPYAHYKSFGDILNHEFGHIATTGRSDILSRFAPFRALLTKHGLMSELMMTDLNEFFPELFLLYRQRRLTGDLGVIAFEIEKFMQEVYG